MPGRTFVMAMNGTDVIIQVNTGTDVTPVWTMIGGQQDFSIDENNDAINVSSKDRREGRVLAGRYSSSFSLDALYIPDDAGYAALKTAVRDGTLVKVQVEEAGVATEVATAICTKLTRNLPDQDGATFSADFTVDGAWSAAA